MSDKIMKSKQISKIRVLDLQELALVSGGEAFGRNDPNGADSWSTNSDCCGSVGADEWSTDSNTCGR